MTDNTRVNELQEKFLKAMDILNAQALSTISFDQTIVCTIEDDSQKKDGKYTVNDGSKSFVAYSSDTKLRAKDNVYVTIPEGKFENQKIIIGKKINETEKPFVFTTPFDTIFDMTDDITAGKVTEGKLVANTLNKYGNENYEFVTLYDEDCNYYGFTRLGLKADFKSWIKNAVEGEYGLVIILTTYDHNIASAQQLKEQEYYYTFSNRDMYGNSYNFETDYEQQFVVPLDKIKGTITNIKINFYQKANFYDKFNKPLPCSEKGFQTSSLNPNIYIKDEDGDYIIHENDTIFEPNLFVKNFYLCMGYDMSIFTTDMVEIYSQQSYTYKHSSEIGNDGSTQNKKLIKVRWVHVEDDIQTDMVAAADKETPKVPYEVRWYRYKLGAEAADTYSGVYWIRIDDAKGFSYEFSPDINHQNEKIKVIIIYNSETPYRSNELVFTNEQDLPPSSEAQHIANALNIVVDDGTNGNYMIYGQDNSIKDTEYGKVTRTLSAYFDVNEDSIIDKNLEKIGDLKNLIWYFPTENTMIELLNSESYVPIKFDGQYEKDRFYIHDDNGNYQIATGDFDIKTDYYIGENENYIKAILYIPSQYYIKTYVQCDENSIYNSLKVYYTAKETEDKKIIYEIANNLTFEQFSKNKTNYWFTDYILCTDENYNEEQQYYEYSFDGNGKVENDIPKYKISSYYSPSKSNNTIICQYTLNNRVYTTEKEFTFGPAGTMGTDQTLVIDFVGDDKSVNVSTNAYPLVKFQIQLYDSQNKPQDISDGSVVWKWYYNSDLAKDQDGNLLGFPQIINDSTNSILELYQKDFKIDGLYILQASIGKLTTYFPIPVQNGEYSYITGPTQVIYQSNGEPAYDREPYKLYQKNKDKVENVKWKIKPSEEVYTYKQIEFGDVNIQDKDKQYYIKEYEPVGKIAEEDYKKGAPYYIYDEDTKIYVLSIKYVSSAIYYKENGHKVISEADELNVHETYYERISDTYIGSVDEDGSNFRPLSIFVKDAPIYGIQAKINEIIIWTQPILVLQNQWPNNVINKWDGENLVLDEKNSTVIAAAISAGKKNAEDNTFSGVMIGDWEGQDVEGSITSQTGIYGFHHGAMSYAFKEDGTAFLGKDGRGRLIFDGNEATIYSATYDINGKKSGMIIDFNDPYIVMNNYNTEDEVEAYEDTNTYPFQISRNFRIDWDGKIIARNGDFTGTISASTLEGKGRNSENPIWLDGYIKLANTDNGDTYFGPVKYNEATVEGEKRNSNGIGLSCLKKDDNNQWKREAAIKATIDNVGMSYSNSTGTSSSYIDIQEDSVSLGTNIANGHIEINIPNIVGTGNYQDKNGALWIAGGGDSHLVIYNIPAENQHGIYARFA